MKRNIWIGGSVLMLLGIASAVQARGFGGARGGAVAGPRGGAAAGGVRGGSYTGPRGTTVDAVRGGGVAVGPYGGVHAGGGSAARVTTPGGKTVTSGQRGGATVGPAGGFHAHGSGGTVASGPRGSVGSAYRGGVAVGPYGGVAAAGGRAVGVGHVTRPVNSAWIGGHAAVVRTGNYHGCFTPAWCRVNPNIWVPTRWRVPNYWIAPTWGAMAVFCGVAATPVVYDYGSSVVIENNTVYVEGEKAAPAEEYAAQAADLVMKGREAKPADDDTWQPLGVFGMIQGEEKIAQNIFQLAINKDGIVRGNYYNSVSDQTQPVNGSLDKKTQRVAWSIGEKKDIVFETGLNNMTANQTTLLVHYGKERTEQMILVRLEEPKEEKK